MPAIKIKNLTKSYGKVVAVKKLDLEVQEGDFFGFIGPNGAGKTTTIKAMLNLLAIDSGTIELLGKDVKENKFQDQIGLVPSESNLYENLSAHEQIEYFAGFYENIDPAYVASLVKMFELDLNKKISDLSLGNKKKISIICALLNKPRLLIFDELTSGLDPIMQKVLFDELVKLNKSGVTIFFSSHNLEEVQSYCKNVAIIREGKIVAIDNIEKVTKQMGLEIKLKTKGKIDEAFFKKERIKYEIIGENDIKFIYNKDINDLIRFVAKFEIISLRINDVKLEEIFTKIYKGEK